MGSDDQEADIGHKVSSNCEFLGETYLKVVDFGGAIVRVGCRAWLAARAVAPRGGRRAAGADSASGSAAAARDPPAGIGGRRDGLGRKGGAPGAGWGWVASVGPDCSALWPWSPPGYLPAVGEGCTPL